MIRERKQIIVPHGSIIEIAREVGKSANTVSLALKGATNSKLSDEIRELAKKKYGGR